MALMAMMAATLGRGIPQAVSTGAAMAPVVSTVAVDWPVIMPEHDEDRQSHQQQHRFAVQSHQQAAADAAQGAGFLQRGHEHHGGGDDQDRVDVGEGTFDKVTQRQPVAGRQGAGH